MRNCWPGAASTASSGRGKRRWTILRSRLMTQRSLEQMQVPNTSAAKAANKAQRTTGLSMDVLKTGEHTRDSQRGHSLQMLLKAAANFTRDWLFLEHQGHAPRQQRHGCNPEMLRAVVCPALCCCGLARHHLSRRSTKLLCPLLHGSSTPQTPYYCAASACLRHAK